MFAVFQRSLKTDKSQSILCNVADKNAQRIWAAVKTHMIDSTAAQLDEDELLQHIINSWIDDGKWCGSNCGYILNWLEQVCLHHETSVEAIPKDMLKRHLKNALSGIKDFHDVETQEELQFCTTDAWLVQTKHTEAVQSVATCLDKNATKCCVQPHR